MKRYKMSEVINNRFYQLPKFLFEGEFKKLSNDARVLYSLLRDRHDLSIKNNWVNDDGEVYLIYTRENMGEMLGCSLPTVRKALKELLKSNLVEEERQGQGLPNIIYLMEHETLIYQQTEKSFQSREKHSFSLEGKNLSPNDTDSIDTDTKNIGKILEIRKTDNKKPDPRRSESFIKRQEGMTYKKFDPSIYAIPEPTEEELAAGEEARQEIRSKIQQNYITAIKSPEE